MEANRLLKGIISVKSAVELGQPHNFREYSEKLIKNSSYDYVLASAHKMADNNDFGDLFYSSENLSDRCMKYLDELEALANWNKFDCIGHLDLVKRYASNFNLRHTKRELKEIRRMLVSNLKGLDKKIMKTVNAEYRQDYSMDKSDYEKLFNKIDMLIHNT